MRLAKIRIAYVCKDHHGRPTVMVADESRSPDRPGWTNSATVSFSDAPSEEKALQMALAMQRQGKVSTVRFLD